ncbi:MAG: reverse transcriptase family protein [Candidatus Thiodiazotropha sp.]
MGTLNVKNVETNGVYVRELLKTCDILALQEHWLFTFQLADIENNFTSHLAYSKAVDEDSPLPPNQKPRGYGGVSILYRKNMDLKVRKLEHGENRMVVVEVQSEPPLCICNVYMPCRNSKGNTRRDDNFQSCLDQIEEVLHIYQKSHIVLVVGDFNASLTENRSNIQDKQFKAMVTSNSLICSQSGLSTFFHPNKTDNAEIDYILCNRKGHSFVKEVTVVAECESNTSDHVPIIAVLNLPVCSQNVGNTVIKCKPKWDNCDKQEYRKFISQTLRSFDSFHISNSSELDILSPLGHLCAVLKTATEVSIPKYKPELTLKKKRCRPWSGEIQEAVKKCRLVWWDWKKDGSPNDPQAISSQRMREAKKCLRREQRREMARRRDLKVESIMAAGNDSKTFFGLIKSQRKTVSTHTDSLMVDGIMCETPEEICQGWATHFQNLALPLQNDKFDSEYKCLVDMDIESIANICEMESRRIIPITEEEVHKAFNKLKNNKAMDSMGLCSEHLKVGGWPVVAFVTGLVNYLIESKSVSVVLKEGLLTPVYKKGGSADPGNYRGITVTPVLLKVLEHVLNSRHNKILEETQSRLQKGFTSGCSSLNAAVILTECILESKNSKQGLLLTTLDTQKAFDVVDHNSLLRRLYLDGVQGDDWLLIRDMYTDCSSRVKWAGLVSDPINIRQGVRQGGVLSTSHYKRYNNPLLLQLEEHYSEVKIGSISIPHVTVADDLAVLARKYSDMQVMLWDVEDNTNRERYCVNPNKSSCLCFNPSRYDAQKKELLMSGDKVMCSECAVHLGISRNVKDKLNVEEKVSIGRKTAYSLMGAGFHSVNGLKTCLNGHIWNTFVVPRLIYGLETLSVKKGDIDCLESFQRKSLRQIQGLPDKTPNCVTLALLGILPIATVIHKNALNLFMSIARNKHFVEYEVAERQLVMKGDEEKSWFNLIKSVLSNYNLPSIYSLFNQPLSKSEWKTILNQAINGHVETSWHEELAQKSSLKYVNPNSLKVGVVHPVWSSVSNSIVDSKRAQLKCKLLTGTYILQGNRAAFNQYTVDATCKLCHTAPETRQHFLAECSAYASERETYIEKLRNNPVLSDEIKRDLRNPELLTQLTLDASIYVNIENIDVLELESRIFIVQIHKKRIARLNQISQ